MMPIIMKAIFFLDVKGDPAKNGKVPEVKRFPDMKPISGNLDFQNYRVKIGGAVDGIQAFFILHSGSVYHVTEATRNRSYFCKVNSINGEIEKIPRSKLHFYLNG